MGRGEIVVRSGESRNDQLNICFPVSCKPPCKSSPFIVQKLTYHKTKAHLLQCES
ncbi:hypothetical protein HMPREF3226_02809 [Prevotella corporis]|uniref:Uncharacterized protein n=1 Tax=Prevotella corporis TaxID=28128 RepID=A0A133PSW7_9BACT|nr:hypothetical protein HMPREF3226_02809 [Prevotella corporis]